MSILQSPIPWCKVKWSSTEWNNEQAGKRFPQPRCVVWCNWFTEDVYLLLVVCTVFGFAHVNSLLKTGWDEPEVAGLALNIEFEGVTSLISGIIFLYQFAQARPHHFLLVKVHWGNLISSWILLVQKFMVFFVWVFATECCRNPNIIGGYF